MSIGIFSPTFPGVSGDGGIGTYTRNLCKELVDQGHKVHVLTYGERESEAIDGIQLHFCRNAYLPVLDRIVPGIWRSLKIARAMANLVRDNCLDIVEFPNWEGVGFAFCLFSKVPTVVRLHTSTLESQRIERYPRDRVFRMDVRLERWSARLADRVVTHSVAHRDAMSEEIGVDAGAIRVIRHGISESEVASRDRLEKTILFVGRLESRKGVLDLIKAFEAVHKVDPDVQIVFIGRDRLVDGEGCDHQQYASANLSRSAFDRMQFLGVVSTEAVCEWMAQCTVFVAPSRYESFGLVFLEAMRFGTPVIGTNAGGIPEVVEDGVTGKLVAPGEPDVLADSILALLGDKVLRDRLGASGRAACREKFSISVVTDEIVKYYAEIINSVRS